MEVVKMEEIMQWFFLSTVSELTLSIRGGVLVLLRGSPLSAVKEIEQPE